MEKDEFLIEFQEILQCETPCKAEDLLEDYEEWDSLSKMGVMAFFLKNFSISLSLDDFKTLSTVQDIINKAGERVR